MILFVSAFWKLLHQKLCPLHQVRQLLLLQRSTRWCCMITQISFSNWLHGATMAEIGFSGFKAPPFLIFIYLREESATYPKAVTYHKPVICEKKFCLPPLHRHQHHTKIQSLTSGTVNKYSCVYVCECGWWMGEWGVIRESMYQCLPVLHTGWQDSDTLEHGRQSPRRAGLHFLSLLHCQKYVTCCLH